MNMYHVTKRLQQLTAAARLYDSARWELGELCQRLTLAGYRVVIDKETRNYEVKKESVENE